MNCAFRHNRKAVLSSQGLGYTLHHALITTEESPYPYLHPLRCTLSQSFRFQAKMSSRSLPSGPGPVPPGFIWEVSKIRGALLRGFTIRFISSQYVGEGGWGGTPIFGSTPV